VRQALFEARQLLQLGRRPSYRMRLRIERAVFGCIAGPFERDFGLQVNHLGTELLIELESLALPDEQLRRYQRRVELAVEATELVKQLASFDPYVVAGDANADPALRPLSSVVRLRDIVSELIELEGILS
jgi:hypothetical protein